MKENPKRKHTLSPYEAKIPVIHGGEIVGYFVNGEFYVTASIHKIEQMLKEKEGVKK